MNTSVQRKCESATHTTTLIQADGTFNAPGLDTFIRQVQLAKCRVSYVVVAIIGPQSTGKSTLLNHLFDTNFKEMDAQQGRGQTTKGVSIAKCVGIEPCTIVMDVEGSDGSEREDDTKFEKQSALFVLAVSDIVMINMWCNEMGREQAANRPLLKTVFEVMLRLIRTQRKTTLMFVIRDKSIQVWNSFDKPEAHKQTLLSELFNVEVVGLSHYDYKKEEFKKEVADTRKKYFFNSIARGAVDAKDFSIYAENIWKSIKANKDLDLPSQKVLVANT